MRKISRVLIGAVSLFLLPAAGEGEKVLAVLRQFGLVGTWSMRCANKASQENPHFAFGRSVGDFPIVIIGDGKNGSGGDIIDAQMVSPTKLRLKAKSDAGDVR